MEKRRPVDVVVVGGHAGAAIGHLLAEQGRRVVVIASNRKGATDSNQKWLHSGLLYPSGQLAERAWATRNIDWNAKRPYLLGPECAYILALSDATVQNREEMWRCWKRDGRHVPTAEALRPRDRQRLRSMGARFAGGWVTPDCVIDFPRLFRDMRKNLAGTLRKNRHFSTIARRGTVMEGGTVLALRTQKSRVIGVDYECGGRRSIISCDHVVLATGAWSQELLRPLNVKLPVVLKKCVVVSFRRKRPAGGLDRITSWLDLRKEDGTAGDFTLVPFRNRVLAAGTDFRVVYRSDVPFERLEVGKYEVDVVHDELRQCVTKTAGRPFYLTGALPRACFKTEEFRTDHPDVDIKVYGERDSLAGRGHGLRGLTVAIPGKASLIFDLAREVTSRLV